MGLISESLYVNIAGSNCQYYEKLGYDILRKNKHVVVNQKILVNIKDVPIHSMAKVLVKCDGCGIIINEENNGIPYSRYSSNVKEHGEYYCHKCAIRLYANKNRLKVRLDNGISFGKWGVDNVCEDFLEKYWDYEKNTLHPSSISYSSKTPVWIKCQEKEYHESYLSVPYNFIKGVRCPYCNGKKTHIIDSLGALFKKSIYCWSDKNTDTPYNYMPMSNKKVWWKCPEGIHNDFHRSIITSKSANFRCPECSFSKGEDKIFKWIKYNNIYYESQKSFDLLVGVGNNPLSYDFYLPDNNLLIEYQGIQHDKPIDFRGEGKKTAEENFKTQQEHDRRKRQYAEDNGINLLEIWYWDYENIETILNNQKLDKL